MSKMVIYDPAMCCSTGLCGVSIDPELLRIATVINKLKENGITVERYNPNSAPQAFLFNPTISQIVNTRGIEALPITVIDNNIVKIGSYLSNEEIAKFFNLPADFFEEVDKTIRRKISAKKAKKVR